MLDPDVEDRPHAILQSCIPSRSEAREPGTCRASGSTRSTEHESRYDRGRNESEAAQASSELRSVTPHTGRGRNNLDRGRREGRSDRRCGRDRRRGGPSSNTKSHDERGHFRANHLNSFLFGVSTANADDTVRMTYVRIILNTIRHSVSIESVSLGGTLPLMYVDPHVQSASSPS